MLGFTYDLQSPYTMSLQLILGNLHPYISLSMRDDQGEWSCESLPFTIMFCREAQSKIPKVTGPAAAQSRSARWSQEAWLDYCDTHGTAYKISVIPNCKRETSTCPWDEPHFFTSVWTCFGHPNTPHKCRRVGTHTSYHKNKRRSRSQ